MRSMHERITTTTKGSITSVQAIYVPADDLTDPAPATTFAHLDATTVLSRGIAELAINPAVDPLSIQPHVSWTLTSSDTSTTTSFVESRRLQVRILPWSPCSRFQVERVGRFIHITGTKK
ncbi:hypothetical protein Q1695_007771 [Nippostrongylus brasiliensis]|nr:hypothetical protein Q1695_007771 [Nippostrongylus brasiliensis]